MSRRYILVVCLRENVTVRVPSLTVGVQWEVLRPIEDPTPNPDCKGGDVLTIWLRHATSAAGSTHFGANLGLHQEREQPANRRPRGIRHSQQIRLFGIAVYSYLIVYRQESKPLQIVAIPLRASRPCKNSATANLRIALKSRHTERHLAGC